LGQADALAHTHMLLMLDLEYAAYALHLLGKIAGALPALRRVRAEGIGGARLAGLMLDETGAEASGAAAALDALIALASARADTTEVVAVASTPAPATSIHGVGRPEVLAARSTQPHGGGASARDTFKGRGGESAGRDGGVVLIGMSGVVAVVVAVVVTGQAEAGLGQMAGQRGGRAGAA